MSGIKKLTKEEIKLITTLYVNGERSRKKLTAEINGRRAKKNLKQIKSVNTIKNYLVDAGVYVPNKYVPVFLNKILVDHTEKTEIMKLLNTTLPTVRKALNGKCGTDISIKIRNTAIERGGVEYIPTK